MALMRYVGTVLVICATAFVADADPDGEIRVLHANGTLRSEGTYRSGEKHGTFRFYDSASNFTYQAYFYRGTQIWRSSDRSETPSPDVIAAFAATYDWDNRVMSRVRAAPERDEPWRRIGTEIPAGSFASLDRTSAARRFAAQVGLGGGDDLTVTRFDGFVNYEISELGIYGHVTQTLVGGLAGSYLTGKSALDLGGTYHGLVRDVALAFRLGYMVPFANDDREGFLGAAAGSIVRPSDAVMSYRTSTAFRSSVSATHRRQRFIVQADVGLDVVVRPALSFEPLARANLGVGIGNQTRLLSLELCNTLRLQDPGASLHALALGGTYWMGRGSLTAAISVTSSGHAIAITSVGYEL